MRHNTHMTQFIPPNTFHIVTGTWTHAAGPVAGQPSVKKTAADETATVNIPVLIPSNSVPLQGSKLASIDIDYQVRTAALDALSAVVNKVTRGADGSPATVAAQPFTYDTGHDTAPERIDVDEHRMTLNITTPFFIDDDESIWIAVTVDAAATSVVEFFGAYANFTARD